MSAYTITATRRSKIDGETYGDRLAVFDGSALIWHGNCSTWPNPYKPVGHIPAAKVYGALAPCACEWQVIREHIKYGKCILINNGRDLPSMWPNVNHENMLTISQIFIHSGQRDDWRGSKGCITLAPADMDTLRAALPDDARGEFALIEGAGMNV